MRDYDLTMSVLNSVSTTSWAASRDLEENPPDPPRAPDAGTSTPEVLAVLGQLCAAMGDAVESLDQIGSAVTDTAARYAQDDHTASSLFTDTVRPVIPGLP